MPWAPWHSWPHTSYVWLQPHSAVSFGPLSLMPGGQDVAQHTAQVLCFVCPQKKGVGLGSGMGSWAAFALPPFTL